MRVNKIIQIVSMSLSFCLTAHAQYQQGYVKTKGRMGDNETVIAGTRVPGTIVQVDGRTAVLSQAEGRFSFWTNGSYSIQKVEKQGFILTDPDILQKQYEFSRNPLVIVLEAQSQSADDKLAIMRRIRRTLQQQLLEKEQELDSLREQSRLTEEEYRLRLQSLYEQQESNEKIISEMTDRYSKIDFDFLDDYNRRISNLIINGKLTEADSLIDSKGSIQRRVEILRQHQIVNEKTERELRSKMKKLKESKALTQTELEDLARDCYSKFEIFKVRHQNDSALFYISLRAHLDTANVIWTKDHGLFIYDYMSDYDAALECFKNALGQASNLYGQDNSNIVGSLYTCIGAVYQRKGNFEQAMEMYQKSLDMARGAGDETDLATSLNDIGMIYLDTGEYQKALNYLKESLAIRERLFADIYHEDLAVSLYNVGLAYFMTDSFQEAMRYYQKALDVQESLYGHNNYLVANITYSMGYIQYRLNDVNKALDMYNEALVLFKLLFGEKHESVATCLSAIGGVYSHLKDYDKALEFYKRALYIKTRVFGPQHPDVATVMNNIGTAYFYKGDSESSLSYFESVLEIRKNIYGDKHPSIAVTMNNIASIYQEQGDYQKAVDYYNYALDINKEVFGESHPRTVIIQRKIDSLKGQ